MRRRQELSPGLLLLVGAALLVVVASVSLTAAAGGLVDPWVALAFGVFIVIGELVFINLPGERVAAPLSAAGALAYALVGTWADRPTSYGVAETVTVVAAAMLVGSVPRAAVHEAPDLDVVARRILTLLLAATLFRWPYLHGMLPDSPKDVWLPLYMVSVVVIAGVVDVALAAAVRASQDNAPYPAALRDEARAYVGIGAAIGATGVLVALAAGVMGFWALPVFAVPLLITQFSFRRYAGIRATYDQTIASLSRVTEVGGYTETGHSARVAALSRAVGREMGLSESELLDLKYAALMHDLGQLSLTDPIPGGATVMVSPAEQRTIAQLGAAVIRQTGVLDEVALIVEHQADPYRRPRQTSDDGVVPVASRVIKAVNAYDDLVGGSLESDRRLEALERLRLGMATEFDPRVVQTLSRIIERTTFST